MCAVSHVVHTLKFSSLKKLLFSFPVAVNNSIKVGPLVFLLQMFVITQNIMKCPILSARNATAVAIPAAAPVVFGVEGRRQMRGKEFGTSSNLLTFTCSYTHIT
jgi:hypothetical protein